MLGVAPGWSDRVVLHHFYTTPIWPALSALLQQMHSAHFIPSVCYLWWVLNNSALGWTRSDRNVCIKTMLYAITTLNHF